MSAPPNEALEKVRSLSPSEQAKLISILARLASPFAGERAAAGLLASAFIERHGLAWVDLASLLQPRPQASAKAAGMGLSGDRRSRSGRAWRGFCRRRRARPGQTLDRLI
jgi:hypothetical protein